MRIKICGLTNLGDALKAEELGADYVGFVIFKNSKRFVSPETVAEISEGLKGKAKKTGLFLDQDIAFVAKTVNDCTLDLVQLHGSEDPGYIKALRNAIGKNISIIKSFKIRKDFDFSAMDGYIDADYFLFDTFKQGMPGGTGETFDWDIIIGKQFAKPVFLAGGLNISNVKEAVAKVKPFALDLATGVESSPGKKDHKLMKEFIDAARQ